MLAQEEHHTHMAAITTIAAAAAAVPPSTAAATAAATSATAAAFPVIAAAAASRESLPQGKPRGLVGWHVPLPRWAGARYGARGARMQGLRVLCAWRAGT